MCRPKPILFPALALLNRSYNPCKKNQSKREPVVPKEMNLRLLRHRSRSLRNQCSPAFSPIPLSSCRGHIRGSPVRNGTAENAFSLPVGSIQCILIGVTLSRLNQLPSPVVQEAAVHRPFLAAVLRISTSRRASVRNHSLRCICCLRACAENFLCSPRRKRIFTWLRFVDVSMIDRR